MTDRVTPTDPPPATDLAPAIAAPQPQGPFPWLTRIARPALLVYWPLMIYLTHSPESKTINAVLEPIKHVQPDKWMHYFGFALLTTLMVFASFAGRRAAFITNLTLGCIVAGLYGIADELTQAPFGRTPDGADITADFFAVCTIYIALLLLHPERRTLPRSVLVARIILALLIPLSGVMLFSKSNTFAHVKVWAIVPEWMGYIQGDHVAHFLASVILTPLIAAAAPLGSSREKATLNLKASFVFMLLISPVIEWIQGAFFDRGAEWEDVAAHTYGVFAAAILCGLWLLIRRRFAPLPPRERSDESASPGEGAALTESVDNRNIETDQPTAQSSATTSSNDQHPHPDSSRFAAMNPTSPSEGEVEKKSPDEKHRFVGHAVIVGIMTLLSRFTGLIRDAVLASALGLSATADAFSIGFLIPNLFRRLFGEGALTAAFIPIYTDLVAKDKLTARRLASLCIAVMLVVLGGLTLVGELVLIGLINAKEWSAETSLALELTMIMLPYMPMICIVALIGGILQVHGRFGAPAAAPIFLNVVMIIGTLIAVDVAFKAYPSVKELHEAAVARAEARTTYAVTLVAWTVLIAGLVQLLWQLAMVLRFEKFTTTFTGAGVAFHRMVAMMVPMFIGLGVFQINTLVDYMIAFGLSQKSGSPEYLNILGLSLPYPVTEGDVAALNWAQRLYQFPLGVFGIAVATAIFPALARASQSENSNPKSDIPNQPSAISHQPSLFQSILHQGLRLTFFIGLPASIGLILLRVPITRLIYERGEFGLAESQRVAFVMVGYCAVVWAYSMTHVLTRAFYAMKDSKTPLRISMWMVLLNFILNIALVWPLGVAGLAWASATAAVVQVIWMTIGLKRFVAQPVGPDVVRSWKMTCALTALMTAVLLPITLIYDAADMSRIDSAIQLAILLPVGAGIFLVGAWLMKAEELKWLRKRKKDATKTATRPPTSSMIG